MDELMKTLEGKGDDNNADEEPADVNGILAVHISSVYTVKEEVEPSMVDLLQLQVTYNGNSKWFPISCTSNNTNRIDCGATRHLPIQLPKDYNSSENWLSIEILIKSPLLLGSIKTVARAMLHIHNIIHESPLYGEFKLREPSGDVFAIASGEFIFAYGMFGFGESFQLHHPVKRAGHFLHYSMFPRLLPPEPRVDTNCMMIPLPTRHPSFIPFRKKVSMSNHELPGVTQSFSYSILFGECVQSNHELPGVTQSFKPKLLKMTRLNVLCSEYEQKKDRHQKLAFLQDLAQKRSPPPSHLDITALTRHQRAV